MRLRTLVLREIFERKSQLLTSFLAILLGITVIVSIKNISYYSEKAVAREMDSLGANVLVLPKSATLQDYYSADMQGETIPEEYVTRLAMSDLAGARQHLAQAVDAGQAAGQDLHAHRHPAQERVPGEGRLAAGRASSRGPSAAGRGGHRHDGLGRQENAWSASGSSRPWRDNEVLVGADVAATLGSRKPTSSTCWARPSA